MVDKIHNKPKEETPITGRPKIIFNIDITPRIYYSSKGYAVRIESYCAVNNSSLAISNVGLSEKGYIESHFDEHHGILDSKDRVVSRSRLEKLDLHNPNTIPALRVLGEMRETVERILVENGNSAYHFEPTTQIA